MIDLSRREQQLDQFLVTGGGVLHVDGEWPEADELLGQRLGAFELIEIVGSGGMATVYRAQRADQDFDQQVAIKVIHAGITDALLRDHFLQERQILANLSHPNIARVFDGGVIEDGRPYLVMEFVDGLPVDEFCASRQLDLEQRVELLELIGATVQHAHSRSIAHRDLKPSNILIDTDGAPKLLDFGIAALFDEPAAETALFTPAYASPEQLRGGRVGHAVDIYQLGVLAYLLLTGRSPYGDIAGIETTELRHRILDEHVPFMSWADRDLSYGKHLSGDLDAIVARCLNKDPADRYPAVATLVDDLKAWRDHRPVSVMVPTSRYVVGKFLQRERLAVSLAAVFLLALGIATSWYLFDINRSEQMAQQSAQEAQQVAAFLESLLRSVDPIKGGGAATFAEQLTTAGARLATANQIDDNVKHELLALLVETLMDRSDYDGVVSILTPMMEQVDDTHYASYLSMLGYAHYRNGNLRQGRELMTDSFEIQADQSAESNLPLAVTMERLSSLERRTGNYQRAKALASEALQIKQAQPKIDELQIATARNSLGLSLRELGELEAAATQFEQTVALYKSKSESPLKIAMTLSNLADVQRSLGLLSEAERHADDAVRLAREIAIDNPTLLATALTTLGNVRMAHEDLPGAAASYRESYQLYHTAFGADHPRLIAPGYNLAVVLHRQQGCEQAQSQLEQVLTIAQTHLTNDHPQVRAMERLKQSCAAEN